MFRFYTPILILQVFTIYQAYRNNADQKWFYLIIFLPFIGSALYLYDTFYNTRNIDNLSEGVKTILQDNYKIEKLKKQLASSDTMTNRLALADEYRTSGKYEKAIEYYEACLTGNYTAAPDILRKLIDCTYQFSDYRAVVTYGNKIKDDKIFRKSEERAYYAWALYETGDTEGAEREFDSMDAYFSNYRQRLEYAKFLKTIGKESKSVDLVDELLREIDSMDKYEKRLKKNITREIFAFRKGLA